MANIKEVELYVESVPREEIEMLLNAGFSFIRSKSGRGKSSLPGIHP